jgi:hypothetical protein
MEQISDVDSSETGDAANKFGDHSVIPNAVSNCLPRLVIPNAVRDLSANSL